MSVRKFVVVCTFMLFALLVSSCGVSDLFAPEPSPTPTRTRRPTATATPLATDTPTATATPQNTATFTPAPPTATFTLPPPTDTFTPAPPTPTFTRRPPTATFTPVPPTATPVGGCAQFACGVLLSTAPLTENLCQSVGTLVKGTVRRADGSPLINAAKTASLKASIIGVGGGPYKYPGEPKDFPGNADGTYSFVIVNKWGTDFQLRMFISARTDDDPISNEIILNASAGSKCGQPDSVNLFVVDWITK
jgi:hypothetical protein